MATQVVILAAGQGKRMYSNIPKVLHQLAGKPLLEHVITTSANLSAGAAPIIIYGHEGRQLHEAFAHLKVRWVEQREQLGTGHALLQALPEISAQDRVLVLYGDVPLIAEATLLHLLEETPENAIGMVTAHLANPAGYGRIKRNEKGDVRSIIEEKDATEGERTINEINSGIYFIPARYLKKWLPQLKKQNQQGEYYLTDVIAFAVAENIPIYTIQPAVCEEIFGVNDRAQLAYLERFYQQAYAKKLMQNGVTLVDPMRFDVRGDVQIGKDVVIDINVILEGHVVIGNHCVIGPNTILRNAILGDHVDIKANCVIDGANIAAHCSIGPFARIRPETALGQHAHVGNFVEVKNSLVGQGSKINHLSYIGDSELGRHVNVGAGTITCNYDGASKHKTTIGDGAHLGSNTLLVAPVVVGEGATIGAGSTVTKDTPPHQLTLTHRLDQRTVAGWQRPVKKIS